MDQFEITFVLEDNWNSRKEFIDAVSFDEAWGEGYQLEKYGETLVTVKKSLGACV